MHLCIVPRPDQVSENYFFPQIFRYFVFKSGTPADLALIIHSKASKKVVFENDFFHIFEYFNGYDCFFSWRSIKAVAGAHFSCISRK